MDLMKHSHECQAKIIGVLKKIHEWVKKDLFRVFSCIVRVLCHLESSSLFIYLSNGLEGRLKQVT